MFKTNKGITLVALVITIIVLLILAGVSISLVVGDNGVLTQASSAAEKTDLAKAEEAVEQAISSLQGDFVDTWAGNTNQGFVQHFLTAENIRKAINNKTTAEPGNYNLDYTHTAGATTAKVKIKVNEVWNETTITESANQLGASLTSWAKSST